STSERWMAGEQMVKNRSETVHICCMRELCDVTLRLFGRHVTGRPQNLRRPGNSTLCLDQAGQTEIGQMGFALRVEQDVPRLNVSMQDAAFMCVMNNACHLRDQLGRAPDRHRLAPDYFSEMAAFHEFHAEIAG